MWCVLASFPVDAAGDSSSKARNESKAESPGTPFSSPSCIETVSVESLCDLTMLIVFCKTCGSMDLEQGYVYAVQSDFDVIDSECFLLDCPFV